MSLKNDRVSVGAKRDAAVPDIREGRVVPTRFSGGPKAIEDSSFSSV